MPPRYQCQAGSSCSRINEWYYQCVASVGGDSSSWALWEQCGGRGGNCGGPDKPCADGPYPRACPSGSSCQRLNEWYHQCRPLGSDFGSCRAVGSCCLAALLPACLHACMHACMHTMGLSSLMSVLPTAPQVGLWDQCGGMSSPAKQNAADPGLCCPSGTTCNFYNNR